MTLRRRSLLAAGPAIAGISLLHPGLALAADKTLIIALPNNPATMDPMQTSNHDGMAVSNAIFENLVEIDLDGIPVPCLAREMPKISDDQLTFTFDLRDDVVFQNGAKFTAEDVKYSYDYMLDPKNKSLRRAIFSPIKAITVESPTRVVFQMNTPFRPFFQYQTKFMGIFPKGSREEKGDAYFANTPIGVGTGPGIFVDWNPNDQLELKRNPTYWRKGVPAWDRMIAKIVPDDTARVAYLKTGQAHIISAPPPHQMAELATTPGIVTGTKVAIGGMWFMQLNNQKKPFDDVNVRRAVSCAIDRKGISRDVFYGLMDPSAVPAATVVPWFNAEASQSISYDPAKAKAYLAKSKYAAEGVEFDLLTPSIPYLIDTSDAAVVMQSQLAAVGIKMNLRPMEMPQVLARMTNGTHTATLLPLMGPSDPTFLINICYVPNQQQSKSSYYNNPALTKAVEESYAHTDLETLTPIYKRMQAILAEDVPHVWLGFVVVSNAWTNKIADFKVNTGLTIWVRDVKPA